jgi:DNA glycosylase AlkZ-like
MNDRGADTAQLKLTRTQILAFRRRVGALDERLPKRRSSLQRAAWAGLQDSMPRAALHSLHARVQDVDASAWEDSSLVQVWGPRYQVYVVAAPDLPVFTLARLPEAGKTRLRAEDLADRLHDLLDGSRMRYDDAGAALGVHGNALRYAALTGRLAIRWEGARRPVVWTVPPPEITRAEATLELARRFLHIFGPAGQTAFAEWAGIGAKTAVRAFDDLGAELIAVETPAGDAFMLASDEPTARDAPATPAQARLLPSGDAYTLRARSEDRALLVPDPGQRGELWTPRVWPGAVLVAGEIVGTWRRAERTVTIQLWRRLSRAAREAVVAEAESLPLPDPAGPMVVHVA